MNHARYMLDGINPEPWQASEGSVGRRNGKLFVQFHKPQAVVVYQQAVAEELRSNYDLPEPHDGPFSLRLFFWRRKVQYANAKGHMVTKKAADATNMQKALEDALQGVLYRNDRDCFHIESWVMEQHVDTMPRIVISLAFGEDLPDLDLPAPGQLSLPLDDRMDFHVEDVF